MRLILETELDSKFFRMGQAALKSFLKYNPTWELHVCDLGLTDAQREELAAVATIEDSGPPAPGPRPHATARMDFLAKLCKLPDTLILHLDADTLTFGSVNPLVAEIQRANTPITLLRHSQELSDWLFSLDGAKKVFERPKRWYSHHGYNFGVAAMLASDQLAQVFARASTKYKEHRGLFRSGDQAASVAELLDTGIMIINMPEIYNATLVDRGDVALFNPPIMEDGTELVILHIPFPKKLLFSSDAPLYAIGWWWNQWLDRYEEEPWPTTV